MPSTQEFEDGHLAAFSGLELTKNPYDQHTEAEKFADWQSGWVAGDAADNDPNLADPSADVELGSADDDPTVLDTGFDDTDDDEPITYHRDDEGLFDEA